MHTPKIFESFGLSQMESRVYVAALALGRSLPKHLAAKTGIKRPTLYSILPRLFERGLLSETVIGKRRYLVAESPDYFYEEKQKDLVELERALPILKSLMQTASAKPVITFYEGIEGLKKVYADNLRARKPILEFLGLEKIHPEIEEYTKNHYIPERIRRRIFIQILISGTARYGKLNLTTTPWAFREVRVVDAKKFLFPLDSYIYGDSVSFLVYREDSEPVGIIIRSREISVSMRSLFLLAWQNGVKQE